MHESARKDRKSEVVRCLAWGAMLALPTLVVGFCTGFYWDGEITQGVELGMLLWPMWLAHTLVPVRGLGWVFAGPVIQWAGYSLLVFVTRLVYRGFRAIAQRKQRRSKSCD